MRPRLHGVGFLLFVVTLVYDVVVWGALPAVPDIGPGLAESAHREALLASSYMLLGTHLDAAVPPLQAFGVERLTDAFGEGFDRIREDPAVAMDLLFGNTWNFSHRWIKTMYWAPPLLLVLSAVLWLLRPKQVRTLGRR